jgi:hypothetical protein
MTTGDEHDRHPWPSARASHELAGLRGRPLGNCASCGEAVFAAESFTRFRGRVVHVRCAVAERHGRPVQPARSAPAVHRRSR